jgi:hypothetical protein
VIKESERFPPTLSGETARNADSALPLVVPSGRVLERSSAK